MDDDEGVKEITLTTTDKMPLTPTRLKILEGMIDPESLGMNVSEKCRKWDISRQSYYDALKDPDFMELVKKTSVDMIKDKIADVLAASVKCATNSGARGFNDRRMLLEMFGVVVKESDNRIVIINIGK